MKNENLADYITEIGNRAVRKAQERNRINGIPNVYCKDGVITYELPNGKRTNKSPFKCQPIDKTLGI